MKTALCVPLLLLSIIAIGYCAVEDDDVDLERGSGAKYGYTIYGNECQEQCQKKTEGKYKDTYRCNIYPFKTPRIEQYCSTKDTMTHKGQSCKGNPCKITKYKPKYRPVYRYTRCDFTVDGKKTYGYCSLTYDWRNKKSKGCSNSRNCG